MVEYRKIVVWGKIYGSSFMVGGDCGPVCVRIFVSDGDPRSCARRRPGFKIYITGIDKSFVDVCVSCVMVIPLLGSYG